MNAIAAAVAEIGGPAACAVALGVTVPAVCQWVKGTRPTPPERCPDIERATGGKVTCDALRPDVTWARVPDASWPHSAGRPTIDVARFRAAA